MSTTIDERVVEMRFDNKQFESNVSTSMSTLDKLKQKLNFSGASKGLEDINAASKKVNMSGLGGAVDSVKVKFSALQVVGVTALANITNSAVEAGKRLAKSLSIDQITSGWNKYEQKTASVQTLVNSTGKSVDEINKYLEKLMWYSDETSYGFTDMTSALATMTSSGGDIEKLIPMIEGVANATAFAGKGAAEFSRIMQYSINQAYSLGYMQVQDWKTIEGATANSKQLIQALIAAGEELGKIEKGSVTLENFRSSLKDKWLDKSVMETGFGQFSKVTEEIYKGIQDGTFENYADGLNKIGNKYGEVASRAAASSQEAKTFTEAIEATKDAVSSGWMKTFELIFGNYEKAKVLWTDLANTLWDVFASGGEVRNQILEIALNFAKPWETIKEKLNGAGFGKIKEIAKTFEKVTDTVKGAADKLEYFQDIVNRVWRGDFNNRGDNPDRFDLLTKAGYDPHVVQTLVNKGYQYKLTIEDIEEAYKEFGLTLETTGEDAKATTVAFGKLTDEQLEQAGLTEDEIDLYRALEKEADRLGISVSELADEMSKKDGRTLLIESFKNALDGLLGIAKAIKAAWVEVFNPPSAGELAIKIYGIIKSLNKFSEKLRLTDKETGELNENGEKLKRTFKGLWAIVDIITTVLGGAFKIVIKVVSAVLKAFNLNILDVTASIGDALVAFRDWLFEGNILAKGINWLISKLPAVIDRFKEWFAVFKETPAVQKLIDAIKSIGEAFRKLFSGEINISEFAASLGKGLANLLKSLPGIAIQIGKDFIAGFASGIADSVGGVIRKIIDFCINFVSSFATALGVHSPSWKAYEIASDFFQGFINGAKAAISSVIGVLKKIGEGIVKIFRSFWDFITDESGNIEWGKIFAAGSIVALILVLKKFADIFGSFASVLDGVGDLLSTAATTLKSFSKVLNGVAWDLKAKALLKMAISIGILVAAIWVLTTIDDPGKLWQAVGVIAVLAVILIALAVAMNKLSAATVTVNKSGASIEGIKSGLLQIGIAIALLALAVKMIGDMDPEKAEQGFKGLAVMAVGMIAFLAAMGGISRYSGDVKNVGKMMKNLAIAMLLMVIVCKLAGNLSAKEMLKGAAFAAAFALFIKVISKAVNSAGNNVSKVGGMMIKLSIALLLMVAVCKLAGKLSAEEMFKGALFAGGFTLFVAALVRATKVGSKQKIAKVNALIFNVSLSLLMMVGVCKLVSKLSTDEMLRGAAFAGGFLFFVKALVSILKVGSGKKIAEVSKSIIAMSMGIAVLAGVCVLLSFLDTKSLAKGITAVGMLSLMMTLMVYGLKGAKDVKGTMMYMTLAIVAMAAAVVALSFIDTKSLIAASSSMAIMMGMFALMVRSLKGLGKVRIAPIVTMIGVVLILAGIIYLLQDINPKNAIGTAVSLGLLMLAMVGVLKILANKTNNPKKALKSALALSTLAIPLLLFAGVLAAAQGIDASIKTVIALTALMYAMTGLVKILVAKTINPKKALKSALALTTLAIPLLAFVGILALMSGISNAVKNAIALTILMSACTALLYPLSYLGKSKKGLTNALKGVLALTAMALPLLAFVGILALMSGVSNAMENVKALVVLAGALTLLLIPLTIIGAFITPALLGVLALTAMAVPMLVFVGILALMNKVENATSNAKLLIDLMTTMTELLIKIALVAPLALLGVTAMTGLVALVGAVGVLAVAIGAVMDTFPNIQKFLDVGLPVLEKISGSIGRMVGNFISGLSGGISEAMVKIGDGLATFITTLSDASKNAATIDGSAFDGVKDLIVVLLEIAAASVGTSIADLFTSLFSGQTSMEKFETDAMAFFGAMKNIAKATAGVEIDQESFNSIISAAQALADLQSSLTPMNGVIQWFTGHKDLASFGDSIVQFIRSMKNAFWALDGMKLDIVAFTQVMMAAKSLAELQSSLEPMEGVVQWFTGRKDLDIFGDSIVSFIRSMKNAFWALDGMTLNAEAFASVIDAATKLSELQSSLEPIGGVVSWFVGRDDLGTFGENVADFIASMKTAFSTLEGTKLDFTAFTSVIIATQMLAKLQGSIEPIGGVVKFFTGRDDLGAFGESIVPFAEGMKKLGECGIVDTEAVKSMIPAAQILAEFQSTLEPMGGVIAFFTGEVDFEAFGKGIYAFATGMQELSNCGTIDMAILQNLLDAGRMMSLFETSLTSLGGVFSFFIENGDLTEFGTGISSFAAGMKSLSECGAIDPETFGSIISAASQLAELEKSLESVGGVVTWFVGRKDLGEFGERIEAFVGSMVGAFNAMNGVQFDGAVFSSIKYAAEKLAELEKSLESVGGVISWFVGRKDLSEFGERIELFIGSMVNAFVAMDGVQFDSVAFFNIKYAAEKLGELESSLDSVGSVVEWFVGRKDLAEFGERMETFIASMVNAFVAMDGVQFDSAVFFNIKYAAEKLAELESSLDSIGGVVEWFAGRKDLGEFGTRIGLFADGMLKLKECAGFDATSITGIVDGAKELAKLQASLDTDVGGVISWFIGKQQDLGTFGTAIGLFADGMAKLKNCDGLNPATIIMVTVSAQLLANLQSSLDTNVGGLLSWFSGQKENLGNFGANIGLFADGMAKLKNCDGLNPITIQSVIDAAQKLSELQSSLSTHISGLITWFVGKKEDLGEFSVNIGLFADAMAKLKTGMGENGITQEVIDSITNAGRAIVELQKSLPTEHWFDGKMNLDEFSEYVGNFAEAMAKFGEKAAGLNPDSVNLAIITARRIRNLITSLADLDTSGVATFTGVGVNGFGADGVAYNIAEAMAAFSNKVADINTEAISVAVTQAGKLRSLINSLATLDTSGVELFKPGVIGTEIKNYADKVASIDTSTVSSSIAAANRLANFISSLTGLDTSGIVNFRVGSIGSALKEYSANVTGFNYGAVSSSISSAVKIRNFISSLSSLNTSGVSPFKTAIQQLSTVNIEKFVRAFQVAANKLASVGADMFKSLVIGMESQSSTVKRSANKIMSSTVDVIESRESSFSEAGNKLVGKLADGITDKKATVTTAVSSCASAATTEIRDKYDSFYNAGSYLVSGFSNGISENAYKATAKAKAMAEAAVEAAREALKINSPSKVFKEIGSGIPEGFAMGIGMLGSKVKQSVSDMASTAIKASRKTMTNVLDALNSEMNVQPTIRPVIDLTDVRSGASAINGLLGGTHAVGLQANFNAINSAMNRKLQNGTNDDIISAINDLGDSLDGVGGDTYNLGGITYSRGDEIDNAVQTIVRAALMGRRV